MAERLIYNLLLEHLPVLQNKSNTGFRNCKCPVCNDYKNRMGIKFENNKIIVNCFNCGIKSVFEEGSTSISKKFKEILNAFQISDEEINIILSANFISKGGLVKINKEEKLITLDTLIKNKKSFITPEVKLPIGSFKINKSNPSSELEQIAIKYLTNRLVINANHDFFLSLDKNYQNRVIIPFIKNDKLIYWQARALYDDMQPRYLNCKIHKTAILYNYSELTRYSTLPIFVTEGVFDAIPINGVSIIGSELNDVKIELLKRPKRRVIFVIQRDKNGKKLAYTALENGFEISFPPDGYKDVNKAAIETGLSWTLNSIMNNISSLKSKAMLAIELNCRI